MGADGGGGCGTVKTDADYYVYMTYEQIIDTLMERAQDWDVDQEQLQEDLKRVAKISKKTLKRMQE